MRAFFRVYRNRFWRLTLFNAVYFCLTLPLLFVFYICVNAYTGIFVGDASVADVLPGLGFFMAVFSLDTATGRALTLIAIAFSALLFGPLKFTLYHLEIGYFTSANRFFSESLSALRKKLPQALLLGVLDLLVLGRTLTNLCGLFSAAWTPLLSALLRAFSLIVLLFWISFRRWMYLLSASCTLRILQILKNGFLLTVSGLGKSAQCSAACAVIWAISFLTVPIVTVVALPLLAYSSSSLFTVCSLYPLVHAKVCKEE